ncbi:NnrS family protein [Rhizobium sp. 18065]|uniref:NnrS family protein n=1 Tax=Rhizobium sp. 18065 TaxID=2681411 RepID=UPI00135BF738|nr:NnrS family protein [Rhizobium sp. 18065]
MNNLLDLSVSRRLLSGGFRLFFPASALVAALTVAVWVPWFLGFMHMPTHLPPVAWHQHELLFGFIPAVVAGFLLTAVPNWTGRPGVSGLPLLLLFTLWLVGRITISISQLTGPLVPTALTLAFLPVLAVIILRELVAAANRRNYKIVAVLVVLSAAQVLFHLEIYRYGRVETADRLALSATILLITIVAGRIVPAFTGNWLKATNPGPLPAPFSRYDLGVLVLTGVALTAWIAASFSPETLALPASVLMLITGLSHIVRQARWCPQRTFREPLVTILHLAYFFVPLGFFLASAPTLLDNTGLRSAGVHAWTTGAVGIMTLAVMTRATRGHTGQALHAPWTTTWLIYAPIVLSALARIAAALAPAQTMTLLPIAGLAWIMGFVGYVVFYGPLILRKG